MSTKFFHPSDFEYKSFNPFFTYRVLLKLLWETGKELFDILTKDGNSDKAYTNFKLLQPENAELFMLVTLLGIVTEVSPEHLSKAPPPMLVTLLGMVIEVSPKQPSKALSPMLVTLLGMVTDFSPEQPWKAQVPMLVTL